MRPIDSGVIGHVQPTGPATGVMGADTMNVIGPLPTVALGTLPEDVPGFEPPEFALARKELEPGGNAATPTGMPVGDNHSGVLDGAVSPSSTARTVRSRTRRACSAPPSRPWPTPIPR